MIYYDGTGRFRKPLDLHVFRFDVQYGRWHHLCHQGQITRPSSINTDPVYPQPGTLTTEIFYHMYIPNLFNSFLDTSAQTRFPLPEHSISIFATVSRGTTPNRWSGFPYFGYR